MVLDQRVDILLDIDGTYKNLAKYNTVSWSKLKGYETCQCQWFVSNFAYISNLEAAVLEHTRAIPGTLIQKMFEIFINERIYNRPEFKTFDKLLDC